jgi:hypothetical protein
MGRLSVLQIEMLLMVCCGLVAVYAQQAGDADLSNTYFTLSGGWGTLGALAVPWASKGGTPAR